MYLLLLLSKCFLNIVVPKCLERKTLEKDHMESILTKFKHIGLRAAVVLTYPPFRT